MLCFDHIGARVRRLLTHRVEQSWIVSSCQGNNEISMWDMETGARQKTLWASSAPALSTTQVCCYGNLFTFPGYNASYSCQGNYFI